MAIELIRVTRHYFTQSVKHVLPNNDVLHINIGHVNY